MLAVLVSEVVLAGIRCGADILGSAAEIFSFSTDISTSAVTRNIVHTDIFSFGATGCSSAAGICTSASKIWGSSNLSFSADLVLKFWCCDLEFRCCDLDPCRNLELSCCALEC